MAKKHSGKAVRKTARITEASSKEISRGPDELFDKISDLRDLTRVLEAMKVGVSVRQAVLSLTDMAESRRKVIDPLRRDIEKFYDLQFTEQGNRKNADTLTADPSVLELLEVFITRVRNMVAEKKDLETLSRYTHQSEVRVGTIPSIATYLMPSIVKELSLRTQNRVDVHIFQALDLEHLRAVQSRTIDFAILAANNKHAQQMELVEKSLCYRRDEQGITFLHRLDGKPGPFPSLSHFIDYPKKFTSDAFYKALTNCSLALMHGDRLSMKGDYSYEVRNLFKRESEERLYDPGGQRIYMPTYRTERYLVTQGMAVGFGQKPKILCRDSKRLIGGHEVVLGTDPGLPNAIIAYFSASALAPQLAPFMQFREQSFSLYLRSRWDDTVLKGGLNNCAKKCVDVVQEICKGKVDSNLKYEGEGEAKHLVHDFIFSEIECDACFPQVADLPTGSAK